MKRIARKVAAMIGTANSTKDSTQTGMYRRHPPEVTLGAFVAACGWRDT